jgi:hypothetical protein
MPPLQSGVAARFRAAGLCSSRSTWTRAGHGGQTGSANDGDENGRWPHMTVGKGGLPWLPYGNVQPIRTDHEGTTKEIYSLLQEAEYGCRGMGTIAGSQIGMPVPTVYRQLGRADECEESAETPCICGESSTLDLSACGTTVADRAGGTRGPKESLEGSSSTDSRVTGRNLYRLPCEGTRGLGWVSRQVVPEPRPAFVSICLPKERMTRGCQSATATRGAFQPRAARGSTQHVVCHQRVLVALVRLFVGAYL